MAKHSPDYDWCACGKASVGMWTSGYDDDPATIMEKVRHGLKECIVYVPKEPVPLPPCLKEAEKLAHCSECF